MGTPNDQAVLQAIFNPDTPFGDLVGLDVGEEVEKAEVDEDGVFPRAQLEQAKALELQGVMAAEAGDLSTAVERFGQAINLLPERASAYNNRAQARRLQGDVAGALEDLERAVTLSGGRGRAARQGFVQRGLLARLQGRDDDARRDFERAARLGSSFRASREGGKRAWGDRWQEEGARERRAGGRSLLGRGIAPRVCVCACARVGRVRCGLRGCERSLRLRADASLSPGGGAAFCARTVRACVQGCAQAFALGVLAFAAAA
ncbi:tetratricopeptide repeat protein 36 [Ailuropoda melanoleuca]|nr:tetratricopeptide repeat protein 36 [Ailuropoda melanoleuca]